MKALEHKRPVAQVPIRLTLPEECLPLLTTDEGYGRLVGASIGSAFASLAKQE